jgi:hypothetical protein
MEAGSLVLCIKGHPLVINEGDIYTVEDIRVYKNGEIGLTLYEATPPPPHTTFKIERFVEIQKPLDVSDLVKEVIYDSQH